MFTEENIDYSDWTRDQLEDRIAEVDAEIIELQEFVSRRKAEKKRKAELMKSVEEIKAELRALGADDIADGTGVETPKRKRGGRGGSRGGGRRGVKKSKAGGRKTKIVRLPVTVHEAVDEEAVDEAFVDEEITEE
jgi:hypothetical protein